MSEILESDARFTHALVVHLEEKTTNGGQDINRHKVSVSSNGFRFCKRRFGLGTALAGPMPTHGFQESASITTVSMDKDQRLSVSVNKNSEESVVSGGSQMLSSAWIQVNDSSDKRSECVKMHEAKNRSSEDVAMRSEEEDALSVQTGSNRLEAINDRELSPNENLSQSDKLTHQFYGLRCNPKRTQRFTDQDFSLDVKAISAATCKTTSLPSSERTRDCSQCGKRFMSWKALFGHMRCHPEREWRGIQPLENASRSNSWIIDIPMRRSAISSIVRQHDSNSRNKERMAEDLSYWTELLTDKADKDEGDFNLRRGGEEVSTSRRSREEGEAQAETACSAEEPQIANSSRQKRKFLDNGLSDLEGEIGGYADAWSQLCFNGWVKGKRSKRSPHVVSPLQNVTHQEPEFNGVNSPAEIKEVADCLVMLAYASRSLEETRRAQRQLTEESAFSNSRRNGMDEQGDTIDDYEKEETNWINKRKKSMPEAGVYDDEEEGDVVSNMWKKVPATHKSARFECETCKRVFNCHQALGGHRSSHRRVKGFFAKTNTGEERHESLEEGITEEAYLKLEDERPNTRPQSAHLLDHGNRQVLMMDATAARKLKGHECSICHRVFASGQALGGHKRRHWTREKATETTAFTSCCNKQVSSIHEGPSSTVRADFLDLNLPTTLEDDGDYMDVVYGVGKESSQVLRLTGINKDCDTVGYDSQLKEELPRNSLSVRI